VSIYDCDDDTGTKITASDLMGDTLWTTAELLALTSSSSVDKPLLKDGKANKDATLRLCPPGTEQVPPQAGESVTDTKVDEKKAAATTPQSSSSSTTTTTTVAPEPTSQLLVTLSCSKLISMDLIGKSDPVAVVFMSSANDTTKWTEVGRTEMIKYCHHSPCLFPLRLTGVLLKIVMIIIPCSRHQLHYDGLVMRLIHQFVYKYLIVMMIKAAYVIKMQWAQLYLK
jgi:hypothetical protein